MALATFVRPTQLHKLNVSQFSFDDYNNCRVIRVRGCIENEDETAKTSKGGWDFVTTKPKKVIVFDQNATFNGNSLLPPVVINPYREIGR